MMEPFVIFLSHFVIIVIVCWFSSGEAEEAQARLDSRTRELGGIIEKIVFVCLGNICRSPMAEFVMKDLTDQ